MRNFKPQGEPQETFEDEEDKVILFGENFIVHTNADKKQKEGHPQVQGYQSLNCPIDSNLAKFCTGSIRDASASINLSQSLPRSDQIAYTAQMVAEATGKYALLFEFFNLVRSEILFDLSVIKMRPLLFQVRKANNFGLTELERALIN